MRKLLFLIIVGVGTLLAATSVPAAMFTYNLNIEFSGGTAPEGVPPWLTATFLDIGFNQVRLTMDTGGLTDNEFVSEWDFNLEYEDTVIITFANPLVDVLFDTDAIDADGDLGHGFDIFFPFPTAESDRFGAGETAVYEFEGRETGNLSEPADIPLTASAFNFTNAEGDFFSAAHVQGIGPDDGGSGWVAATESISAIPEPGSLLLLGTGLAGLFGIRRFKLTKN